MTSFLTAFYSAFGAPPDGQIERQGVYYFWFFAVPSATSFFIVVLTTIFLVVRLRKSLEWRRETSSQGEKSSDKETKLVRTIIAVSTIFIICFSPNVMNLFVQIIHPPFRYLDPYLGSLTIVMFSISGVFQAVSSSINIFFYYKMSSRYRKTFSETFIFLKGKVSDKN